MKISVIMQSYLGDYPGSRSNPEKKFTRAVESFLKQTHNDKELVIVADGCKKTFDIYHEYYSKNNLIKFCYISKTDGNTYDMVDGKKLYRGTPKKIGVSISTGDIITYLDSDDIMLKTRLEELSNVWSTKDSEFILCINVMRWLAFVDDFNSARVRIPDRTLNLSEYEIDKLFELASAEPGVGITASYSLSHRKINEINWRDTFDVWEDNDFATRLSLAGKVFIQESPTYVVCHMRGKWDY